MTTALYLLAAFGGMSIGACIGLAVAGMCAVAKWSDDQQDEDFFFVFTDKEKK